MKNHLSIMLLALLSNIAYSDAAFDSQLELAEQGDAEAQWLVGVSYQYGIGALEHDETGIMWYTKAADQGHAKIKDK